MVLSSFLKFKRYFDSFFFFFNNSKEMIKKHISPHHFIHIHSSSLNLN